MADTIKSALFVDYDSFHRSQDDENGDAAERLAQTSAVWVSAIEGGKLILPPPEDGARRRVLIRRCYADPALLGLHRSALIASGFEVIDCPHQPGRKRNAADLHMVIDTLDALDHPAGYDEFILISADADLTPVLLRLRAHNRNTVVYGDEATTASYKAIADGMIDATRFAAVLAGDTVEEKAEAPALETKSDAAEPSGVPAVAADRNDIETLARKVHASTNVPMFSPRTFADLFRVLAQEIGEHGYHFQNTAENVTDKLVAAGRNVNRRQVMFIVKGLALKGHVFSTTDTPEHLAEVFREQAVYLIGNSGLDLDEREKAMLPNWIIGRTPAVVAKAPPAATPPKPGPAQDDAAKKATPVRRRVTRPTAKEEEAAPTARAEPPKPPARLEPSAEKRPPAPPTPVPAPAARPAPSPGIGGPSPASRTADVRASVASRFAAITKGTFSAKPSGDAAAKPRPVARPATAEPAAATPRPPPPRPIAPAAARAANGGPGAARPAASRAASPKPAPTEGDDALESSILAAIAQAVDVLVDDTGTATKGSRETREEIEGEAVAVEVATAPPSQPEPPPDPEPSPGGDSEDIGDEIQRIIASYSRARSQE